MLKLRNKICEHLDRFMIKFCWSIGVNIEYNILKVRLEMKHLLLAIVCFLTLQLQAQDEKTLDWINNNAIEIEDADPDTELSIFNENIPEKFADAKIYGFGEASHNGKEFFTLKAKFFKYLVKTQNVKAFIMEEDYPSEFGINEWISGGKGDVETIADNFYTVPWKTKEVVNLLAWMRSYNLDKPIEEQIRFYGMDIQNVNNINHEIRDFVKKYSIPVNEELLVIVDSCVNKKINYKKSTDWADIQIPKLKDIEQIILDFQTRTNSNNNQEFISAIRALNYLIKYTYYLQHSTSQVRDLKMFENVKSVVDNKAKNGKAFIWAHNEHINNKEMLTYGSGWTNLGGHLKKHYKDDYYSVYFDFGVGKVPGYVMRKKKPNYWDVYEIDKPFRKTYAETLFKADMEIYFIDMNEALKNNDLNNFFGDTKKQLMLAASGYNPKNKILMTKKYSEMFDGLIFVKNISVPNYHLK